LVNPARGLFANCPFGPTDKKLSTPALWISELSMGWVDPWVGWVGSRWGPMDNYDGYGHVQGDVRTPWWLFSELRRSCGVERPGRGQNAKRSTVVGFLYTAAVTKLQTTSRDHFPPTRLVFLLCPSSRRSIAPVATKRNDMRRPLSGYSRLSYMVTQSG